MIPALALGCALDAQSCTTYDARRFFAAVDRTTEHDGLRAILVVFGYHESGWSETPRPQSWDAQAGKSCSWLQLPCYVTRHNGLDEQLRIWLSWEASSSLASMCGYGRAAARMAFSRARQAENLLRATREAPEARR